MDVLILAGGLGTRLSSVSGATPKVMVPVCGKPFLAYLLERLKKQQFQNVCLAIGFKAQVIEDYFHEGNDWGIRLKYSKEARPLGTGGAIKKAIPQLSQEFLVLNGDSYIDIDFNDLIRFHKSKQSLVSMAVLECDEPDRYGIVEIDEKQRVTNFNEKASLPGKNLINGGAYIVNKEVFEDIPIDSKISFEKEILPHYVNKQFFGFRVEAFFIDIGTPLSYYQVKNGFGKGLSNDCTC